MSVCSKCGTVRVMNNFVCGCSAAAKNEIRLPFEKLTASQLRRCLDKCGKAHKGMSKREMVRLLCALIGQPATH